MTKRLCFSCNAIHPPGITCRPRWAGPQVARAHKALLLRDGPICQECGKPETDERNPLTVDHVVPRMMGGSDALTNLRLVHLDENLSKGAS